MNTVALHNSTPNGNMPSQDLFVMSDEQILEIEPQEKVAPTPTAGNRADHGTAVAASTEALPASLESHLSEVSTHAAEPPEWLAAQMKDPWNGADARELWDSAQSAEREAAAYREVFAKPEDARASAERARTLDDIDRAYFAGDATQRAQLAATMMREDPAAFREMVFEGLRALEAAGMPGSNQSVAEAMARISANAPTTTDQNSSGRLENVGVARRIGNPSAATNTTASASAPGTTVSANSAASTQSNNPRTSHDAEQDAQLAAYAAFEKSANADLERSVGSAIERTLTNALPRLVSSAGTSGADAQHAAPLQGRLAAAIRQDVEKALQGDRQLGEQIAQILSGRRFDNETRAQVVRLIDERAQQLVPVAAKRALKDWTQSTLAAHSIRNGRPEFAPRGEVTAASSSVATGRTAAAATSNAVQTSRDAKQREAAARATPRSSRVDYRKLSDEQILEL